MAANQDTRYNITLTPTAENQGTFTLELQPQVVPAVVFSGNYVYNNNNNGINIPVNGLFRDFIIPQDASFTLTFDAGQQVPNMVGNDRTLNLNVGNPNQRITLPIRIDVNGNDTILLTATRASAPVAVIPPVANNANAADVVIANSNANAAAAAAIPLPPNNNDDGFGGGKSRRLFKNKTKKSRKPRRKSKSQKKNRRSRK
jgi:hypothetical protein